MFRRSSAVGIAPGRRLLVGALLVLCWQSLFAESDTATKPQAPVPRYNLRCWQHGQLLFEASDIAVPVGTISGLKLRAADGKQQPMVVADTGTSLCLLRALPES